MKFFNEEDRSFARPFDSIEPPPSEAELLHYINHKLGHTNALLEKLVYWAQFVGGSIIVAAATWAAKLYGWI